MERTALKRIGLAVAVALLVATAGCSSLGGGGDGGDGAGYGVSGDQLDGQTLQTATVDAVESAGSYTTKLSTTLNGTRQGTAFTADSDVTTRVNLDAGTGLRETEQTQSSGDQSRESTTVVYTDGNTSYRKQAAGGETTYGTQEGTPDSLGGIRPVNVTDFNQRYGPIVDALAWEQDGTDEVDGVTVSAYTVTGVENGSALGLGDSASIENVSGAMLVDADGVVREVSLEYAVQSQGSTSTFDATITLSGVGSTTVSEPDWLSKAQSA